MDFEDLSGIIFEVMIPKLQTNRGLAVFARERAKFEGWLKLELCESLSKYFKDVAPERDRIDIRFDGWGIELKTVNTNYRYRGVIDKHRPITKNVQGVVEDIDKLRSVAIANKAVLFIVFPATHGHRNWQGHLRKITSLLVNVKFKEFRFRNGIPGIAYFGAV